MPLKQAGSVVLCGKSLYDTKLTNEKLPHTTDQGPHDEHDHFLTSDNKSGKVGHRPNFWC